MAMKIMTKTTNGGTQVMFSRQKYANSLIICQMLPSYIRLKTAYHTDAKQADFQVVAPGRFLGFGAR
jgi:hypothetical protein